MSKRREQIQAAWDLFTTEEAEAYMCNQGVINVIADIDEIDHDHS